MAIDKKGTETVETSIDAKEKETTYMFMDKISQAQMNDDEWVETTPEIIRHYNRKGLGQGIEYFIFQGIKVCEHGKSGEIQAAMDKVSNKHGDRAIVVGRT